MIGGKQPRGYTIVEVMIFLAITGFLLFSVSGVLRGKTDKTRFTTGVNEFDASINSIVNELASGYYPKFDTWQCTAPVNGNPVTWSQVLPNSQGRNTGCILSGNVVHPYSDGTYNVYTMVGRRRVGDTTSKAATTLAEAKPTLVLDNGAAPAEPNVYSSYKLPHGLAIKGLKYTPPAPGVQRDIDAFAFITTLGWYSGSGSDMVSSAQAVDVAPICSSYTNPNYDCTMSLPVMASDSAVNRSTIANRFPNILGDNLRNTKQIVICIAQSSSEPSKAAIIIGGDGGNLSTRAEFNNVTVPAPAGLGCP